jgi:predicted GNAT family acetyltransferase
MVSIFDRNSNPLMCAIMTPPHALLIQSNSCNKDSLLRFTDFLINEKIQLPGVNGIKNLSDTFATIYCNKANKEPYLFQSLGLYQLHYVNMPTLPNGCFRLALDSEIDILNGMFSAFNSEIYSRDDYMKSRIALSLFMQKKSVFVWEVNNELVSMAIASRPTANAVSISGVYTSYKHRKKGYATACVALLSKYLLDKGYKWINLFTDLSNPTSNDIYQKIGYYKVCEYNEYLFENKKTASNLYACCF